DTVQSDVDANETAANTAIANVQSDVDANEVARISADTTLQTNIDTVQSDVDANETAANTAIANVQSDVDANEVARISADTTLQTNIDTVQSDVDANETAANTAIANVQSDVDANEVARISADTTLQTNIDTVQSDVDANETATNNKLVLKADLASPTFTGTVSGITSTMVGLGNVDNTSDANKPVSTAGQAALDLKENSVNKSTDVTADAASDTKYPSVKSVKTYVDASASAKVADAIVDAVTTVAPSQNAVYDALVLKANLASPTFTGTPTLPTGSIATTQTIGNNTTALATTAFVTSATTGKFVDLTTNQTISGVKTFNSNINVKGLIIGLGAAGVGSNTSIGVNALVSNSSGVNNVAIGEQAGFSITGSNNVAIGTATNRNAAEGDSNIAIGNGANYQGTSGSHNVSLGTLAYRQGNSGSSNIALGFAALYDETTGSNNIALGNNSSRSNNGGEGNITLGFQAGNNISTGDYNVVIGYDADVSSGTLTNATAIGNGAVVAASNTIQLGNSSVTAVNTSGAVTASSFIKSGGTSSQFLKADGSVDAAAYAPLASPTFTGTVSGITSTMVGLANVNNTSDANKPVSTSGQAALDLKVDRVTGKGLSTEDYSTTEKTKLAAITGTNTGDQDLSSYATNANLALKADIASPTFTGTVSGITSTMVGLANVNNTSDANKPVSTSGQAALDLKVDKVTGKGLSTEDYSTTEKTKLAAITGTNTGDQDLSSYATNANLALKANIASPTFTGTVSGITSTMVGLANVDNTSDANKPVSTAGQAALALKANIASPTFTGTVSGITSTMVGLANVNNTSDANKPVSTAGQAALDLKVDKVTGKGLSTEDYSTTEKTKLAAITGTNTGDQDLSSYATNANLALKANIASPTFTGTVSGITSTMVGLANVNNTSDANKPVSTAGQAALDLKVDKVTGKGLSTEDYSTTEKTKLAAITGSNTGDQDLSSYATNANLALKANIASPTFTGTVSGITSTMVGLANVNNTSDANKPVSTAGQTALDLKVDKVTGKGLSTEDYSTTEKTKLAAITGSNTGDQDLSSYATNTNLDLKANIASPTFTGTVSGITSSMVGLANVDNTSDANKQVSTAGQTALNLKANIASPTFTGTVSGITSTMVGLANVDNTSDANKPVSTAGQTALNLKANIASPTFTGTVSGITSTMVGLANVDNTSDANKPVSTAGQAALDLKANLVSPTFTGTPTLPTGTIAATQTVGNNTTAVATTAFVTAAITGNYVDLTTNQTIAGTKTFSSDITINNTKFGKGAGSNASSRNIAVGNSSLVNNTSGQWNTAIGTYALQKNSTGSNNTAIGNEAVSESVPGSNNTGIGNRALMYTSGTGNTSVGSNALINSTTGNNNTAFGLNAFLTNTTGSNNTALGASTVVSSVGLTNVTAIGYGATVAASNTIQLGNTAITDVNTSGAITALSYIKSGGTSSQFLMADGSVSSGAAAVREVADEFTPTGGQTSFTLSQTPSPNSKVKMYINGIRISNTAYSTSGTTLIYAPGSNGNNPLVAEDRIQFDFYY
ncbi:hypothetical protein, partial [Mariniflexile sp. AS56]|uniref:beta strand repeat-containing protein n=1 Tax=Mariniflexile sp. AS56 TaxID=3063957 RepID=UPI0026F280F1